MKQFSDPRRDFLIRALSAGLYATGSIGILQPVWAMGKVPQKLVAGKSIYDLSGDVRVNGKAVTEDSVIDMKATITTGENSHVIFVVGQDAFILRSNSHLKIEGNMVLSQIKLISGKLLSVFGRRREREKLTVKTTIATIGIRGTGMYLESEVGKTYICTCYGTADLQANADDKSRERVKTQHHDAPRYILSGEPVGKNIQPAPVFNHSDDELALIETLVGREVPFNTSGYSAPRKNNY